MLNIHLSLEQIDRLLGKAGRVDKVLFLATRRSINTVATRARSRIAKQIAKEHKFNQRVVRKNIVIVKANQRYLSGLRAHIVPWKRGMQAYAYPRKRPTVRVVQRFGHNKVKRVVRRKAVRINVKGEYKTVQGGFIVKLKSGHRGIFRKKERANRKPIEELYSSSIVDFFKDIKPQAEREAQQELNKVFDHQLKYYKAKYLDGGGI